MKNLGLVFRAMALGASIAACGGGEAPPPVAAFITAYDGVTNGNGDGLWVQVGSPPGGSAIAVELVTWPELESVPATVTEDTAVIGSLRVDVEPDAPLEARWYALAVTPDPSVPYSVLPHVVLADGRLGFRVFGTSAPRLRRARWSNGATSEGSAVYVELSEGVIFDESPAPIVVTAGGEACTGSGVIGTIRETSFTCPMREVDSLRIEILEPMPSPGGGSLEPAVIDLEDASAEYVAPIE